MRDPVIPEWVAAIHGHAFELYRANNTETPGCVCGWSGMTYHGGSIHEDWMRRYDWQDHTVHAIATAVNERASVELNESVNRVPTP